MGGKPARRKDRAEGEAGFIEFDDRTLPLPLREGGGGRGHRLRTPQTAPPRQTAPSTARRAARTAGSAARPGTRWPAAAAARAAACPVASCQVAPGSRSAWIARSRGEVSIRCSRSAARKVRRHAADRPQRVGHQRAAARPGFHQQHRVRPADQLPGHRRPQPEDLAEHLADLRRRGEVARTDRARVIGRVGARHEPVEPFHQPPRAGSASRRRSASECTATGPWSRRRSDSPGTRPARGRTRR